ncbi:hypothetical protein NPIL_673441, partial [Nephila pilipes]
MVTKVVALNDWTERWTLLEQHFSKPRFHQKKVMVTVSWLHYENNAGEEVGNYFLLT